MKKELTCIVCPMGCRLTVTLNGNEVTEISGNTCPRGAEYAKNECTNPTRMLTTTAPCGEGVVPVKTRTPVPKNMLFKCMEEINSLKLHLPVYAGDVIIENILGTGVDIIASDSKIQ